MAIIGIRELSRRTGKVVDEVGRTKRPAIVTRRGRPTVAVVPVDPEALEDYVLANAPEFVEGLRQADRELAEGKTVLWSEFREEFLTGEKRPTRRPPRPRKKKG